LRKRARFGCERNGFSVFFQAEHGAGGRIFVLCDE